MPSFRDTHLCVGPESISPVTAFGVGQQYRGYGFSDAQLRIARARARPGMTKNASNPRATPRSRGTMRPSCADRFAPERQRAQGKPGARCTHSPVCKGSKHTVVDHRFTGTPGLPCAMVLTVSFVLPGDRLVVTVAREQLASHELDASAGASDRDRGTSRDATPPTPPGIRVRTTAVRSS
jgi:hypothetical protein